MALIVEDGSIVEGANSFVSVADAETFFASRGIEGPSTGWEIPLTLAMDQIMLMSFKGYRTDKSSPTPFPRTSIYDLEGNEYDNNTVPAAAITGQLWLAYYEAQGVSLGASVANSGQVKKEKVDVLEIEYASSESTGIAVTLASMPNANAALLHLLNTSRVGGTGNSDTVIK